jgi:hypothetical protein
MRRVHLVRSKRRSEHSRCANARENSRAFDAIRKLTTVVAALRLALIAHFAAQVSLFTDSTGVVFVV